MTLLAKKVFYCYAYCNLLSGILDIIVPRPHTLQHDFCINIQFTTANKLFHKDFKMAYYHNCL